MAERPWMPMYWGDYVKDTLHLNTFQHGCYLLLIAAYWIRGGPLPNDPKYLAQVCRTTQDKLARWGKPVVAMFHCQDGLLVHKRIEKELLKQSERSASARASAQQRARAYHSHSHKRKEPYTNSENLFLTPESDNPRYASHTTPKGGNGVDTPKKRGTRMPPDWEPSPKTIEFCQTKFGCSDSKLQDIYEGLVDWALSTSSQKAVKLDWDRTFIGAVRREMRRVQEAEERERKRQESWREARRH